MFFGRRVGKWVVGSNIGLPWLLMYVLMGGFVLYCLAVGHTP
jgi:hypothetical protein